MSEQTEVIAAASSTLAIQLHLMLSYLLSLLPSRLIFFSGLTSLCSLYLSVISALVFLLSLPLTSQIAFGMYLLFHEWGESLQILTITLSTSFSSTIVLLLATA